MTENKETPKNARLPPGVPNGSIPPQTYSMKATIIIALGVALGPVCEGRVKAHEDLIARITTLTAQLSTNQNNVVALIQRADLYRLHGDWTEARSDYAAVSKLAPNSAPLLLGRAQLHVDQGEDAAARAAFDDFLSRFPTNSVALLGRARVLTRLGERKAAIADYSRAIAVGASPQPEDFLERASLQATEFSVDEAIKGLDEGLTRLGWLVTFQKAAIDYELKRQRSDQALARLETIIARANRKETWLAWKGEILMAAGKSREAQECFLATLKAIDALPPRMNKSPSMAGLRAKVEFSLASLRAGSGVEKNQVGGRWPADKKVD